MIAIAMTNSICGTYHVGDRLFLDNKARDWVYDKRRKSFKALIQGKLYTLPKEDFNFYDDGENGHDGHELAARYARLGA